MSKYWIIIYLTTLVSIYTQIVVNETIPFPMSSIPNYNPEGNSTVPVIRKSSSGGLSAGAICAIAIPCAALLLGVGIAAALLKGTGAAAAPMQAIVAQPATLPPPNIDTSLAHLNIAQPQVQPVSTPEIIQPVQIEPQPAPQLIRPNYPINQVVEPPAVNNTFKPMLNQYPEVKMVKVQKVEMVPVEQTEMVAVQEVVPVQETIQQISSVPIPQGLAVQHGPVQQGLGVQNIQSVPVQQGLQYTQQSGEFIGNSSYGLTVNNL